MLNAISWGLTIFFSRKERKDSSSFVCTKEMVSLDFLYLFIKICILHKYSIFGWDTLDFLKYLEVINFLRNYFSSVCILIEIKVSGFLGSVDFLGGLLEDPVLSYLLKDEDSYTCAIRDIAES